MNVRYHIGKCLWHISNALTHYLLIATKAYQQTKRTVPLVCASLISARLASLLGIPFYEDIAECHSKHRVGAVFTFGAESPKESNIIVFDDFVTTGATMISMKNLLEPLGKNLVFFTAISNKLWLYYLFFQELRITAFNFVNVSQTVSPLLFYLIF